MSVSRRALALAAGALLLAACTPGSSSTTEATTGSAGSSASDSSTATPPDPDAVSALDLGPPGEQTLPGTQFALGAPGWFDTAGTAAGEEIGGTVGVTVLEIRRLEASVLAALGNQELDEGFEPFAVIFEHQWYYEAPEGYRHEPLQGLYPVLADGVSAAFLSTDGGVTPALDMCGLDLPEYDQERQIAVNCMVALGENGSDVVGLKFVGEEYGYTEPSEGNLYVPDPVVWQLPKSL